MGDNNYFQCRDMFMLPFGANVFYINRGAGTAQGPNWTQAHKKTEPSAQPKDFDVH
jgi:hypothetical protein